ncbi:mCG147465 [Mus musculus]|nr:mCG147465 [Mus musculus]
MPTPLPSSLLLWGIKPSQDQGLPFQLMPDKAIFCYLCSKSQGALPVFSLVGGVVPGSSGREGEV